MKRYIKTIREEDNTGYASLDNVKLGSVVWNIDSAANLNFGDLIYLYVGGHQKIEYRGTIVDILSRNKSTYKLMIAFVELPNEIADELTIEKINKVQPIVTRQQYLFKEDGDCQKVFDLIKRVEKEYYHEKRDLKWI